MRNVILQGDCLTKLRELPDESVDCIVTSPPYYGLRDYGVAGQIGLEPTLNEYLGRMLLITAELKRVLKKTGTMWWNHGDSYAGGGGGNYGSGLSSLQGGSHPTNKKNRKEYLDKNGIPAKSLELQAHRLAIRMVDEQGWILRNQIIWHKPNVMPSSVKDRFTVDFEPIFFFSKSKKYWFEPQYEPLQEVSIKRAARGKNPTGPYAVQTGQEYTGYDNLQERFENGELAGLNPLGRNKRTVWKIATKPFKEAHFATYPEALIEPMIKAGCPVGGVVLDPFFGAGTTGLVAKKQGKNYIGIELNPEYIRIAEKRLGNVPISLFTQTICQ